MALLSLHDVSIAYGGPLLLDRVALHIESGDRACLVGRNGAGKSTLLKIIAGELEPDAGRRTTAPNIRVAYLPQEMPADLSGTVGEIVRSGAAHRDGQEHWEHDTATDQVLARMDLDPGTRLDTLSGGQLRRALLARALAQHPDILLLDEPTNHLDIETIQWLETFLPSMCRTLVFVTHDRTFAHNMANRIIDLDRAQLADWRCDYPTFLERKARLLEDEAARWERLDKRAAVEEVWLRQGIKARRTRDEGRVRALFSLRERCQTRRIQTGQVRMQLQAAESSGNQVLVVDDVTFGYPDQSALIRDFTTAVMRGDRVGIIGPNGSGKTTLMRLLCGELQPDTGSVRQGTRLQPAYFDQLRNRIDSSASVFENIADGRETVKINGHDRSVYGYLKDFLFDPEGARQPAGSLSGGERNRLLIAKLFATPSNLLVMDEPTNDLDMDTLELLEEQLQLYPGTLILVSHDRTFLNNVVSNCLVLEGNGVIGDYVGGYDDWSCQRPEAVQRRSPPSERQRREKPRAPRMGFNEKREFAAIPGRIEALEEELDALHARLADPLSFQRDPTQLTADQTREPELNAELETLYHRWAELEALQES